MKSIFFSFQRFLLLLLLSGGALAQDKSQTELKTNLFRYDNDFPSPSFHAGRREALRNLLPEDGVACLFSNPVMNRSGDVDFPYHQDPNFYYLSGYTAANAALFIFKSTFLLDGDSCNEVLFLQERIPSEELWNGRMLGTIEAKTSLGFKKVFSLQDIAKIAPLIEKAKKIYAQGLSDFSENNTELKALKNDFLNAIGKSGQEKLSSENLKSWLTQLREIKQEEEIRLMRKAIDISCAAHLELMRSLQSDAKEYQAQSIVEYVFKSKGAEAVAYPSIVGSGENSCILHYETNRRQAKSGDLMLIDAGAEYHGYAADITRTLPLNGVFSEEQKAIYNIVLQAQEAGIKACRAGNQFYANHTAAAKVIKAGLLELGIINDDSDYRKYFMHGTSHYLGLDVHDVGRHGALKPGNVVTIEPGIYIPEGSNCDKKWWNIGVRIEDNILVTDADPINLSEQLPRTIEEIEAQMKLKGIFEKAANSK